MITIVAVTFFIIMKNDIVFNKVLWNFHWESGLWLSSENLVVNKTVTALSGASSPKWIHTLEENKAGKEQLG